MTLLNARPRRNFAGVEFFTIHFPAGKTLEESEYKSNYSQSRRWDVNRKLLVAILRKSFCRAFGVSCKSTFGCLKSNK